VRSVGALDANRRGVTRLETIVTDVENPPVGHVPGVDRQVEYWRMDRMAYARRFDHVGITVADLDTVTAFFVGLGLEVEGTDRRGSSCPWLSASLTPPSMRDQPDVRRRAAPAFPR
jgi:hypothetical protein